MLKVYGYSDDILVIDGAPYPADEIGCFNSTVKVQFADGTLIEAGHGKNNKEIWWIKVLEKGTAPQKLTTCDDEDAEIYSDILEIDADYVWHEVRSIWQR